MGSLDDAIREHLELKRQRGASDEEVKRQEEEAFGRGRRPVPEDAPADDSPALDHLPDQQLEAAEPQSNGQPAEHAEAAPTLEPEAPEPEPFEPDEVPAEESLQTEVTLRDARDEPAEDWDEAEEPEEAEAESSSDPLQETPEFLEGSPEEDRLWFEQRPPKDFDLD
ncbi:MAG: hypothetical protein ACRDLQ_09770 [Solirubrobacterales bacterium]